MQRFPLLVGLDGVLVPDTKGNIHEFPDPFPGAAEFTQKLSEKFEIHLFTIRTNIKANLSQIPVTHAENDMMALVYLQRIVDKWLTEKGIVFDRILPNRPKAIGIIDDVVIQCSHDDPLISTTEMFQKALEQADSLAITQETRREWH